MTPQVISISSLGSTAWIPVDYKQNPFNISLACVVSNTPNLTYQVEFTLDDVFKTTITPTAFTHSTIIGKTSNFSEIQTQPIRAIRLTTTAYVSGTVTLTALQGAVNSQALITALATDAVSISGKLGAESLIAKLQQADKSVAIQVLGDSTSNEATEWPTLLAQTIAAAYPAWSVQVRLFDTTFQQYGVPSVIQTGLAGTLYLDRTTGANTRSLAAAASTHMSGTIDVRAKLNLADWTPAAVTAVCGRSDVAPNRGWYAYIDTTGKLGFAYSTDGTALSAMLSTVDPVITDGTDYWVRWVFQPDDGGGNRVFKAYKSADGFTWTQVGTTVTMAGAVSVYNNTTIGLECGGITAGVPAGLTRVYEIQIRNGLDGPMIAPGFPDLWPPTGSAAVQCVGAPVLTIVNGSVPGAGITVSSGSYLSDSTRLPKLLPDYGQDLCILSTSHNDGRDIGSNYRTVYKAWIDSIKTYLPWIPIVPTTQNPEYAGSTFYREHNARRSDILATAASLGLTGLDVANEFLKNPSWTTNLMTDSVHPNSAGEILWANLIYKYITAANDK